MANCFYACVIKNIVPFGSLFGTSNAMKQMASSWNGQIWCTESVVKSQQQEERCMIVWEWRSHSRMTTVWRSTWDNVQRTCWRIFQWSLNWMGNALSQQIWMCSVRTQAECWRRKRVNCFTVLWHKHCLWQRGQGQTCSQWKRRCAQGRKHQTRRIGTDWCKWWSLHTWQKTTH